MNIDMSKWTPASVRDLVISLGGFAVAIYLVVSGLSATDVLAAVALLGNAGRTLVGVGTSLAPDPTPAPPKP